MFGLSFKKNEKAKIVMPESKKSVGDFDQLTKHRSEAQCRIDLLRVASDEYRKRGNEMEAVKCDGEINQLQNSEKIFKKRLMR